MIFFAVVSGTPSGVARIAPRLLDALETTRLIDGDRLSCASASGTWAAAALATSDAVCPSRLASEGDALVVVNGPAIASDGDQRHLTERLLQVYRSGGSQAVAARLGGTYNFVGVAPEVGLRAFHDCSGLFPLYWYQGPDFTLISNRSQSVAHAVGSRGWNENALAWVVAQENLVDEHMPARDVRYVPPGYEARAGWGAADVCLARSPTWIWPGPSDEVARDNLSSTEWDDVTNALVAEMRATAAAIDGPLRLGITGGKDSRLCLAIAKAAGLEDRITTYTNGGPLAPEVCLGREVATAAGFAHDDKSQPDLVHGTPEGPGRKWKGGTWQRLQQNITRYEGIVGAWSALQNPTEPPFVNFKGWVSRLYRGGSEKFRSQRQLNISEVQASFVKNHEAIDLLGIMRPERKKEHAQWLARWVEANAVQVRADLLPEKFFVDFRLGHWSGPNLQCAPLRININPLALQVAAEKNLELSVRARNAERFHFEVMRRAAPELVAIPFWKQTWSSIVAADSPVDVPTDSRMKRTIATARRPLGAARRTLLPRTVARPSTRNPGWAFLDKQRKEIEAVFDAAGQQTVMGEFCDLEKLRNLVRGNRPIGGQSSARELVNTIGVALTLLERAEPVL